MKMIPAKIGILICFVLGSFISTNSLPTRNKRFIDLNSPCLNIPQLPNEPQDISSNLDDLLTRADALGSQSEDILSYIAEEYSIPEAAVNYLKTNNVLDLSAMTDIIEDLDAAAAEPTNVLNKTMDLLFQSSAYVQYVETNGKISQLSGNPSLKTKHHDVLTEVNALICATNIALIKQQVTAPSLTLPEFPSEFISFNKNFTQELYRAYIVMNDGNTLMNYLTEIYTHILNP